MLVLVGFVILVVVNPLRLLDGAIDGNEGACFGYPFESLADQPP